jgi:hypothetical protein
VTVAVGTETPGTNPAQVANAPAPTTPATAPTPQAPAPAPVEGALHVEAVPQPKPAEQAPAEDAITPVQYEETGDVGLDMALQFAGNLGLSPDHPAMAAALEGNFDLIRAVLAGFGDKSRGWEQYVALAEKSFKDSQAAATQAQAVLASAIHDTVGGEENWKTIQAWASKEATPAEKAAINKMLTGDPVQARAAAQMLSGLYEKAGGVRRDPASAIRSDASGNKGGNPSNLGPLNRREAVAEIESLRRRVGDNFASTPEYAAIHARIRR